MDGTASLIYLLAAKDNDRQEVMSLPTKRLVDESSLANTVTHGAITRGAEISQKLALVFTGDEYGDGAAYIARLLQQQKVKASFFFTGRFYRNAAYKPVIQQLKLQGHYLGPHSNEHLLYCDWNKRDSLLVTKKQFNDDLDKNYAAMQAYGISKKQAPYFLPPFEWYNDTIAAWTKQRGLQLVNFTAGTYSNADYTTPDMKNYRSSAFILDSIINYDQQNISGLNGFILLVHVGTQAARTDKFYHQLPRLITYLKQHKYKLTTINELLK